jgi:hypothetical protein
MTTATTNHIDPVVKEALDEFVRDEAANFLILKMAEQLDIVHKLMADQNARIRKLEHALTNAK